ncbi:hypothetical protein C8Q73DRAFT_666646 [Cubamyces lactineus]|nr:hypothetical protein C8Q73DRAFT_666646 [Cubamyces lactineus]
MAPHKTPCKWTDDHIETMLDSLYGQKAGFGQGGNLQNFHFQVACDAVNNKCSALQNQPKTVSVHGTAIAAYHMTMLSTALVLVTPLPVKGQCVFLASMQSQPAASQGNAEIKDKETQEVEKDAENAHIQASSYNAHDKTPVKYSDNEDVLVLSSQKMAETLGLLKIKHQASDEQSEPGLQWKKSRPSCVQVLIDVNKHMDHAQLLLALLLQRHQPTVKILLPIPAQCEHHLQDADKVTEFLRYLGKNPALVITYNTLVALELAELHCAYVKQYLQEYEEKEERRALGMYCRYRITKIVILPIPVQCANHPSTFAVPSYPAKHLPSTPLHG